MNNIFIENTKFMPWGTNFSGDPTKDRYGSQTRKGQVVIPDDIAKELLDEGFNVKLSKPSPDSDIFPVYYTNVILSYKSKSGEPKKFPPRVFFNEDGISTELSEETVGHIDEVVIERVDIVLNKYESFDGRKSLYINSMEVYRKTDNDPISMRHRSKRSSDTDDEYLPF